MHNQGHSFRPPTVTRPATPKRKRSTLISESMQDPGGVAAQKTYFKLPAAIIVSPPVTPRRSSRHVRQFELNDEVTIWEDGSQSPTLGTKRGRASFERSLLLNVDMKNKAARLLTPCLQDKRVARKRVPIRHGTNVRYQTTQAKSNAGTMTRRHQYNLRSCGPVFMSAEADSPPPKIRWHKAVRSQITEGRKTGRSKSIESDPENPFA